jgi:hypothetical protein
MRNFTFNGALKKEGNGLTNFGRERIHFATPLSKLKVRVLAPLVG